MSAVVWADFQQCPVCSASLGEPCVARADGMPIPGRPGAVRLTRVFAVTPHTGRKLRAGAVDHG